MVNDKIVVLATNTKDRSSLLVSGIESLSIEQLIGQSLKEGKLQTALNIVMETGQGRRQLREYQLKLSDYSDMDLLEDFLQSSKDSLTV